MYHSVDGFSNVLARPRAGVWYNRAMKAADYKSWYERAYPELTGYGSWLRGGEINTLPPAEYDARPFRVLFARLSTYHDVATSFTHHLLYQIAAGIPGVYPDLAYLPPENDSKIFARDRTPWLLGTQTKLGPAGFSLIGFSNSIVQELINIPKFLASSGIPLAYGERIGQEDIPLIILGGANAPFTSALKGRSSLVDGIFIGNDPAAIRELISAAAFAKKRGVSKLKTLAELATIPGFYPVDDAITAKRKEITPPDEADLLAQGIVPYSDGSAGSGKLAINEGCRALCSFCAENWMRKPYREYAVPFLVKKALAMKAAMALEEIELYSFNVNMHTDFYEILWELLPFFRNIGLKSQRFDMLATDPAMVACQKAIGKAAFSAGLEGISPRIRRYLNKNLDEATFLESLEMIFSTRPREIKIFLLSTGIEEGADFIEFGRLVGAVKELMRRSAETRVVFSITPLVAFPWTPLEFGDAASTEDHQAVIRKIKNIVVEHGLEAREAMDTNEYLVSQILVRASDERVLAALTGAVAETHFIYHRRIDHRFLAAFLARLKREGLHIADLLKGFSYDESLAKPWAAYETGIERKFLWETHLLNLAFTEIGARMDAIEIKRPAHNSAEYAERIKEAKRGEVTMAFRITVAEAARGLARRYIGTALGRALMRADDTLTGAFRAYRSSYWAAGDETKPVWITGDETMTLVWDKRAIPLLEKALKNKKFMKAVNDAFAPWGAVLAQADAAAPSFVVTFRSSCHFKPADYFKKKALKATQYKDAPGAYHLDFSKESLRKGILISCAVKAAPTGVGDVSVVITAGAKFDPHEFMREAFVYPRKHDWVRIRVSAQYDAGNTV